MDHIWENFAPWSWNTYSYNKDINYSFDRELIIGSINISFFEQRSFYNCLLASNVKFHADAGKQFVSAYPFRYDLMTPMRGTEGQKKNYWCTDFFFFFLNLANKTFLFFNDLTRYNDYNSNIVHIAPSEITIFLQLNVLVRFLLWMPTGFQGCLPVYINSWTVICLRCWGT